uniref:Uncharacterized protein n=1 Tax=Candidatus Kentrum sp. DK TaxID=2126562 RepID=A0A450TFL7_9GAMM|nr:MAG: hypothetical protein BECKDK2373C_GA0170839_11391 [Candidatus Kentron sp. DK]
MSVPRVGVLGILVAGIALAVVFRGQLEVTALALLAMVAFLPRWMGRLRGKKSPADF